MPMILSLQELPSNEDALFEFKSSKDRIEKIGEKVCKAASAFSNTGGGTFVAGVDDSGNADGGFADVVGRTSLRDWIDKRLQLVQPAVRYKIEFFSNTDGRGTIEQDKVVFAVEFFASEIAPHMSSDNIYYIRSGAHSDPAKSFVVEALLAKRSYGKPMLTYLFRRKPGNSEVIQLALVPLTSAPAVGVTLHIDPLSDPMKGSSEMFPLKIPVIDSAHPFAMDIDVAHALFKSDSRNMALRVDYNGTDGSSYSLQHNVDAFEGITPFEMTASSSPVVKALNKIADAVKR